MVTTGVSPEGGTVIPARLHSARAGVSRPRGEHADAAAKRSRRCSPSSPTTRATPRAVTRSRAAAKTALEEAREDGRRRSSGAPRVRWCSPAVAPRPTTSRVKGAAHAPASRPDVDGVVTTAIEHKGVLAAAAPARDRGVPWSPSAWTAAGWSTSTRWRRALDERTAVVSVMLVNNEVGTIQPLAEVAARVAGRAPHARAPHRCGPGGPVARRGRARPPASISWRSRATSSAGPKGVGVLVVRDGVRLDAEIEGGGQERGLRARHGQRRRRGRARHRAAGHARAARPRTWPAITTLRDRLAARARSTRCRTPAFNGDADRRRSPAAAT